MDPDSPQAIRKLALERCKQGCSEPCDRCFMEAALAVARPIPHHEEGVA